MLELTQDITAIIVYRGDSFIIYYNFESYESWIIFGTCNRCGKCLPDGWLEDEHRLDIPVRPEINEIKQCSLSGVYL